MRSDSSKVLGSWWEVLNYHPVQDAFWRSEKRFAIACAGRRSGKTKIGKMKAAKRILRCRQPQAKFIFAAPTRDQAKRIFWEDLKVMFPKVAIAEARESELVLVLVTGQRCCVVGMDRPERAEGEAIDGVIMDEFADMRESAWVKSIRPGLSTMNRLGWAIFTGKPRGRNHYWRLIQQALMPDSAKDWDYFHWMSADILPKSEIDAARRDMDPASFAQEYEASFINFEGRAYYAFDRSEHVREVVVDPSGPIGFCFDFNVAPGVAAIVQEQIDPKLGPITAVLDEVWIENNSNTLLVCQRLAHRWKDHKGPIYLYGDATGGARGTSKLSGSDWDIISSELARSFSQRCVSRVKRRNPSERARVNAMNARLRTADGKVHELIHPRCVKYIDDLEGVQTDESGAINKAYDPALTHMSDAVGYYMEYEHPIFEDVFIEEEL